MDDDKEKWTYWNFDKKGARKYHWTRGAYCGIIGTNIMGAALHAFYRPSGGMLMIPAYMLTYESCERIRKEYPADVL